MFMKKLIFISIILFCTTKLFSQEYSEVIEVPEKTADQLYSRANEWFALTFKSAKDVIQLNDPAEKKIIGKGIKRIQYLIGRYKTSLDMNFTLMVQFKDGRFRYNIQSSEFYPLIGSEKYTYELIKERTTVGGVTEHLKSIGAIPWAIGKKQIELTAEGNRNACTEAENQLHAIIADLSSFLYKTEEKTDNW